MVDYNAIAPAVKLALQRYVDERLETGGFLNAVLSDRLFEAVGRADQYNLDTLHSITTYIYMELPSNCWGSPAVVKDWLYTACKKCGSDVKRFDLKEGEDCPECVEKFRNELDQVQLDATTKLLEDDVYNE